MPDLPYISDGALLALLDEEPGSLVHARHRPGGRGHGSVWSRVRYRQLVRLVLRGELDVVGAGCTPEGERWLTCERARRRPNLRTRIRPRPGGSPAKPFFTTLLMASRRRGADS